MRDAAKDGPEAVRNVGVDLALEVGRALASEVAGFHIATPGGELEPALRILEGLELGG